MNRTEYRVVHKTPRAMEAVLMPSKEQAQDYIRMSRKYLSTAVDLKIQARTVTDWEDV